jgi:hypothetical protein
MKVRPTLSGASVAPIKAMVFGSINVRRSGRRSAIADGTDADFGFPRSAIISKSVRDCQNCGFSRIVKRLVWIGWMAAYRRGGASAWRRTGVVGWRPLEGRCLQRLRVGRCVPMPNLGLGRRAKTSASSVEPLLLSRFGWPLTVMSELHSIEPTAQAGGPWQRLSGSLALVPTLSEAPPHVRKLLR